jgi:hypothetical protein
MSNQLNALLSKFTSGEVTGEKRKRASERASDCESLTGTTEATVAQARSMESALVGAAEQVKRVLDDKISPNPVLYEGQRRTHPLLTQPRSTTNPSVT